MTSGPQAHREQDFVSCGAAHLMRAMHCLGTGLIVQSGWPTVSSNSPFCCPPTPGGSVVRRCIVLNTPLSGLHHDLSGQLLQLGTSFWQPARGQQATRKPGLLGSLNALQSTSSCAHAHPSFQYADLPDATMAGQQKLLVKTLTGQSASITPRAAETVGQLKQRLKQEHGLPK